MSGPTRTAHLPHVAAQLSARDQSILSDLARVRLLHARHIERLHFTDGTSALSRSRRSRRTLQRLYRLKLVKRLDRRIGGLHASSAGFIYTLDSLGQRLLRSNGPAGGQRRRSPWEPSVSFQDHILAISELYVKLRELERRQLATELIDFQAEPMCWRRFSNPGGATVTLKPDAFVRLADGDYEQVSFIEVDRGTEHAPTLKRKLGVYIDGFEARVEQQSDAAFPNVVWIVPDPHRATVLERLIDRLPPDHAELFRVSIDGVELPTITGQQPTQTPKEVNS